MSLSKPPTGNGSKTTGSALSRISAFAAGVAMANSGPHLASLITGREHLTPLGGRSSGPLVNGVWASLNLAVGVALLQPSRRRGGRRWDNDLPAFELGCLCLAAWLAASEAFLATSNHHRD
ncbi:hypothetical protein [Microlunatus sp. Gsoil 973]|uniref:hypothetical protein n=1 Tax=Microlunatus sp. Gsoil 973 TaxID=2672569 RepID=UPI0012B4F31B|nr:hypothetical protein [Microlunatus sp. Gsoil 973]QGN32270.1 hypothetical protein GJV80_05075 [Microlunatus sp. Gsoil 973]